MRAAIAAVLVSVGCTVPAWCGETELHVSPRGDDAMQGTVERPLRSLHGAQRRVREALAAKAGEPVRVKIADGEYLLTEPLTLTPADSGSAGQSVTWEGDGGDVRITSGVKIGGWQARGDIWTATLSKEEAKALAPLRQVWVNGRRAIRARSPNDGYFRVDRAGPDARTSFFVQPKELVSLGRPESAEVMYLHNWSVSYVPLTSIDAAVHQYHVAGPIGCDYFHGAICYFEPHPRYRIENAAELLDSAGEWFYDEPTRELRYWPRAGETLATAEIVAPALEQLVVLRGDGDRPVENVRFENLAFEFTRFIPPVTGYRELQANWHDWLRKEGGVGIVVTPVSSAVALDGTEGCEVNNCRFEHLGGWGLSATGTQRLAVERCSFSDLGGNGVTLGGTGAADETPCEHNRIEDCQIERCGQEWFGAVGIWVGMASYTQVRHNELHDLPYTGISVGWRWDDGPSACHHNLVENNHIHHVLQLLCDGGGIYTLGRQPGTVLAGNHIHGVPLNSGSAHSNGIFMDEGTTDVRVAGNTIYDIGRSPIRFNRAANVTLSKNRLAAAAAEGTPMLHYDATPVEKITLEENQEFAAEWEPPTGDEAIENAGPHPDG